MSKGLSVEIYNPVYIHYEDPVITMHKRVAGVEMDVTWRVETKLKES